MPSTPPPGPTGPDDQDKATGPDSTKSPEVTEIIELKKQLELAFHNRAEAFANYVHHRKYSKKLSNKYHEKMRKWLEKAKKTNAELKKIHQKNGTPEAEQKYLNSFGVEFLAPHLQKAALVVAEVESGNPPTLSVQERQGLFQKLTHAENELFYFYSLYGAEISEAGNQVFDQTLQQITAALNALHSSLLSNSTDQERAQAYLNEIDLSARLPRYFEQTIDAIAQTIADEEMKKQHPEIAALQTAILQETQLIRCEYVLRETRGDYKNNSRLEIDNLCEAEIEDKTQAKKEKLDALMQQAQGTLPDATQERERFHKRPDVESKVNNTILENIINANNLYQQLTEANKQHLQTNPLATFQRVVNIYLELLETSPKAFEAALNIAQHLSCAGKAQENPEPFPFKSLEEWKFMSREEMLNQLYLFIMKYGAEATNLAHQGFAPVQTNDLIHEICADQPFSEGSFDRPFNFSQFGTSSKQLQGGIDQGAKLYQKYPLIDQTYIAILEGKDDLTDLSILENSTYDPLQISVPSVAEQIKLTEALVVILKAKSELLEREIKANGGFSEPANYLRLEAFNKIAKNLGRLTEYLEHGFPKTNHPAPFLPSPSVIPGPTSAAPAQINAPAPTVPSNGPMPGPLTMPPPPNDGASSGTTTTVQFAPPNQPFQLAPSAHPAATSATPPLPPVPPTPAHPPAISTQPTPPAPSTPPVLQSLPPVTPPAPVASAQTPTPAPAPQPARVPSSPAPSAPQPTPTLQPAPNPAPQSPQVAPVNQSIPPQPAGPTPLEIEEKRLRDALEKHENLGIKRWLTASVTGKLRTISLWSPNAPLSKGVAQLLKHWKGSVGHIVKQVNEVSTKDLNLEPIDTFTDIIEPLSKSSGFIFPDDLIPAFASHPEKQKIRRAWLLCLSAQTADHWRNTGLMLEDTQKYEQEANQILNDLMAVDQQACETIMSLIKLPSLITTEINEQNGKHTTFEAAALTAFDLRNQRIVAATNLYQTMEQAKKSRRLDHLTLARNSLAILEATPASSPALELTKLGLTMAKNNFDPSSEELAFYNSHKTFRQLLAEAKVLQTELAQEATNRAKIGIDARYTVHLLNQIQANPAQIQEAKDGITIQDKYPQLTQTYNTLTAILANPQENSELRLDDLSFFMNHDPKKITDPTEQKTVAQALNGIVNLWQRAWQNQTGASGGSGSTPWGPSNFTQNYQQIVTRNLQAIQNEMSTLAA